MVGRAQSAAQALQYATSRTALRRAFFPACCHVPPLRIKKTLPLLMLPHSLSTTSSSEGALRRRGLRGRGGGGRGELLNNSGAAIGKRKVGGGGRRAGRTKREPREKREGGDERGLLQKGDSDCGRLLTQNPAIDTFQHLVSIPKSDGMNRRAKRRDRLTRLRSHKRSSAAIPFSFVPTLSHGVSPFYARFSWLLTTCKQ